jgi:hypothetical protein
MSAQNTLSRREALSLLGVASGSISDFGNDAVGRKEDKNP